jgi:hypothetical protein
MTILPPNLSVRSIPPETYIHTAKISTKVIIFLTFLALITLVLGILTCVCCCQRRIWRFRAGRIARAKAREMDLEYDLRAGQKPRRFKSHTRTWKFWKNETRKGDALRPRIHERNARFYAPGLSRKSGELRDLEMKKIRNTEANMVDLEEVRRPGKVFAKWKREIGV